jgi:hypothetical protein
MGRLQNPSLNMNALKVFWHVSCINNWYNVVAEQARHLKIASLAYDIPLDISVFTTNASADRCLAIMQVLKAFELRGDVTQHFVSHDMCEKPTIIRLNVWARENDGPVLYLHAKGVSQPEDRLRTYWRWHMNCYLLGALYLAVKLLSRHAWIGSTARNGSWPYPHAPGNYFLTTGTHLRGLPDFLTFRNLVWPEVLKQHPHLSMRHADEMWLGSTHVPGFGMAGDHEVWQPSFWSSHPEILRYTIKHGS